MSGKFQLSQTVIAFSKSICLRFGYYPVTGILKLIAIPRRVTRQNGSPLSLASSRDTHRHAHSKSSCAESCRSDRPHFCWLRQPKRFCVEAAVWLLPRGGTDSLEQCVARIPRSPSSTDRDSRFAGIHGKHVEFRNLVGASAFVFEHSGDGSVDFE